LNITHGSVKLAITGYGKADKVQVKDMVQKILKLKQMPKIDDTTDAIAIALTYIYNSKFESIKEIK